MKEIIKAEIKEKDRLHVINISTIRSIIMTKRGVLIGEEVIMVIKNP
jgi:hypothetical protein